MKIEIERRVVAACSTEGIAVLREAAGPFLQPSREGREPAGQRASSRRDLRRTSESAPGSSLLLIMCHRLITKISISLPNSATEKRNNGN